MTKEDKKQIIDILKNIDVKKLEVDHPDERIVKWFRFGSFTGLRIAVEVISAIEEDEPEVMKKVS